MIKKLLILGVLFSCQLVILPSVHSFTRAGFDAPESFIADPETGAYYVSNVNGVPMSKDGNGYISKISANGNVVIQKFIGGGAEPLLNAPKGMAVVGQELWVTDIDVVRVFNKQTAKFIRTIIFSEFRPRFLNDLTADSNGRVYVSDMLSDQILMIDPVNKFRVSLFCRGAELGNPNGLVINPKTRSLMSAGFKSGEILEIDRQGKIHCIKRGLRALDGIDYDINGNLYVSSFEKGEIYKIPMFGRGTLSIFQSGLTTPADISCNRRAGELLIPSMTGNTITTLFLSEKKNAEAVS